MSLNVVDVSVSVDGDGDGDEAVDEGRRFDRLADCREKWIRGLENDFVCAESSMG